MTTLAHRTRLTPPVVIAVTIRLDIGLIFWPVFALVWLAWLGVARLGRWLRDCREWWAAAGVVAKRRLRRWVRSWKADLDLMGLAVSGLIYGPVWGVE